MVVYRLAAYDTDMVPQDEEIFATEDLAKAAAGEKAQAPLTWEADEKLAERNIMLWSAEGADAPGAVRWFEVEEFPVQGAA